MKASDLVRGFALTGGVFSIGLREVPALLFSRRAKRAVRGLVILRRAYEYVVCDGSLGGRATSRETVLRGVCGCADYPGRKSYVGRESPLTTFDDRESA